MIEIIMDAFESILACRSEDIGNIVSELNGFLIA